MKVSGQLHAPAAQVKYKVTVNYKLSLYIFSDIKSWSPVKHPKIPLYPSTTTVYSQVKLRACLGKLCYSVLPLFSLKQFSILVCFTVFCVNTYVNSFPKWILSAGEKFCNKPGNIPAWKQVVSFHVGILLGLFDPEDEGDMFLRNIGWLSTD
jgi:hypothetical protein